MEMLLATEQEVKRLETSYPRPSYAPHKIIDEEGISLAYIWFRVFDCVLEIDFFEVVNKGKGIGKAVIHYLFDAFDLAGMKGEILRVDQERPYRFWTSLGAEIGGDFNDYGPHDEIPFYLFLEQLNYN